MNIKELLLKFKKNLRNKLHEASFTAENKIEQINLLQLHDDMNVLFVTFDSCRFDSMSRANTSNLDKYGNIFSAWTPAGATILSLNTFCI